jgi:hypothetical protein
MQATLPRRGADDLSGELLVAAYRRSLGHHPKDVISYLSQYAVDHCKWFPTIAECREIIDKWERRDEHVIRHRRAKLAADRERQTRFNELMAKLSRRELTDDQVNALSDYQKRVGETRSYLWRNADGSYRVRR